VRTRRELGLDLVEAPLPSEFHILVGYRNLKPLTQEPDIMPIVVV